MTFRSVEMKCYTMVVYSDHAYETINQIGKLESVHFKNMNFGLNKPFNGQIRRCEELLHSVNMMKSQVELNGGKIDFFDSQQKGYMEAQHNIWKKEAKSFGIHDSKLLDYYQIEIKKEYESYLDARYRIDKLKLRKKGMLQKIACMETISLLFGENNMRRESQQFLKSVDVEDIQQSGGISFMIGIIDQEAELRFNRMIYRVSRGYAYTRSLDSFKFKGLAEFKEKVIILIYPNSTSQILGRKLLRVMQTFCTDVSTLEQFSKKNYTLNDLTREYEEIQNCTVMEEKEMSSFLQNVASINFLDKWRTFLWKEKYLYECLNKMEIKNQFMLANIYIPLEKVAEVSVNLAHLSPVPTLQELSLGKPPTVFDTNSYTTIAQEITDTYGTPRYQEVNPSIFTTITFPFFFGVMFGDIGHGLVLFALGLYLIFNDDEVKKTSFKAFSRLRYMLALMGFFAFYCGWIYNDLIGFNINVFGSCYDPPELSSTRDYEVGEPIPLKPRQGCIYPIGIDPIWGRAENQLVFGNALKMKLAVIIGVLHMIVGICVKAFNSIYFKKKLDFWFEFVPQITFMVVLFGYMDFLIVFKWLKVWNYGINWAPSIITTMMNIGLGMGKTSDKPDGGSNMWGQVGHSSQDTIQLAILFIAFICVPLMLLPKPIIQIKNKKKNKNPLRINSQQGLSHSLMSSGEYDYENIEGEIEKQEQQEEASQIFVHQLIQTIQFVLGTVSNTASYLRLWALSLAHSQLAKVFFQKTLENTITMKSLPIMIPGILVMFYVLCWITTGVLMCMDTMQCFLHALRLHWVEFQNKFYKGDGYKFEPISFQQHINQMKNKDR